MRTLPDGQMGPSGSEEGSPRSQAEASIMKASGPGDAVTRSRFWVKRELRPAIRFNGNFLKAKPPPRNKIINRVKISTTGSATTDMTARMLPIHSLKMWSAICWNQQVDAHVPDEKCNTYKIISAGSRQGDGESMRRCREFS